ncbi:MAG: sodium:calcium symporter [Angelakisella sp.]|nr:sodium:calcium symporter [Angelakisella sp.]MCI9528181.1 sodium:calcium symporter [Angelakisella sp.]
MTKTTQKKLLWEGIAVALGLIIAFIPAPQGLEQNAMWTLGLLIWAIVNWVSNAIPDFVCIFIMCCTWVLMGIVPFTTAFNSFSGTTVWLLIAAMGIGAAVTKSGLLARVALCIMRICPPTFKGQVLALLGSGVVIGPFIPSTIAKVSIVGAMATDIGGKLGFENRSKGMSGLWSAMYAGYTLLSQAVLSASFFSYIIMGLLPEEVQAQFSWFFWLRAMLPWLIICTIASYIAICFLYRPQNAPTLSKEDVSAMLDKLGPMSRDEKITLGVLVLCIIFWVLERTLNVPAAVTAVLGMSALLALKVITPKDYNQRINWSIIAFMGGAINLATAITTVGIDSWLGNTFGGTMAGLISNPYLFVPVIATTALISRFVIVDMTTDYTLFTVILTPFCLAAGVSPWVAAMAAYCVVYPYFTKYQNINYLAAFNSAGGDEKLEHSMLVPFCLVFHIVSILALTASVPYWQMLGLIPR